MAKIHKDVKWDVLTERRQTQKTSKFSMKVGNLRADTEKSVFAFADISCRNRTMADRRLLGCIRSSAFDGLALDRKKKSHNGPRKWSPKVSRPLLLWPSVCNEEEVIEKSARRSHVCTVSAHLMGVLQQTLSVSKEQGKGRSEGHEATSGADSIGVKRPKRLIMINSNEMVSYANVSHFPWEEVESCILDRLQLLLHGWEGIEVRSLEESNAALTNIQLDI